MYCGSCGERNETDHSWCGACGAYLGAEDATIVAERTPLATPPAEPAFGDQDPKPGRPVALFAGAAALLVCLAIGGILWWSLAGRSGDAPAAATTSSSTSTTTVAAPTPSTVTVTSTPPQTVTTTVAPAPAPTTEDTGTISQVEAQDFFDWYYSTAPIDPSQTWGSLSAGIQSVGTGYDSYQEWWYSVASAQSSVLSASGNTVRVRVQYVHTSGKTRDETYTYVLRRTSSGSMQLANKDGG